MTQRRALITGFSGFTGQYVARELQQAGYAVYGTGIAACDFPNYFQLDLLDKTDLADLILQVQPHVVVHLAAVAFVGHGNADDFYRVNLIGTRHLLEALAANARNLESVLLASSANVYGNSSQGQLSETTPPDPANDYAVSKLAMEYMAGLWRHKLPLFIVRPFNYTGVGQSEDFLIPKIVGHFRRRAATIELGNIDVWRDFSDVRMVARIYRQLLETKPLGQTINVGSGQVYSLREIIVLAEEITGHHLNISVNPAFVRANDVRHLGADTGLLQSIVGEIEQISLKATLQWMIFE